MVAHISWKEVVDGAAVELLRRRYHQLLLVDGVNSVLSAIHVEFEHQVGNGVQCCLQLVLDGADVLGAAIHLFFE